MLRKLVSAMVLSLAMGFAAPVACGPATAAEPAAGARYGAVSSPVRQIRLAVSKSIIIDYDEEIRDILVSNPLVADAVVRTNRRLYLLGNKFGTTNIFVFGASGRQIAALDVQVQPDTNTLEGLLKRLVPGSDIRVEAVAGTVVLSGSVRNAAEAMQAQEVAARFVGAPAAGASGGGGGSGGGAGSSSGDAVQIVNALTIRSKDQVMLKVTIAEVQRSIVKQLGIDLVAASTGSLSAVVNTVNPFAVNGTSDAGLAPGVLQTKNINATVRALEQNGVMRTLAEPNLTAISGEEATFLVGGEYPVPVAQDSGTISIEFKKYGISLGFVPVVLSEGRISLKVNTEVSELTSEGSISVNKLNIQGLRVRRADTTVEIPSGGTMVMAGLIRDDVRQSLAGVPGMMSIPILGTLFRSRDFQRSQSELAIFVQPLVVQPVAAGRLQRPDQNFQASSDAAASFMGRLNKMYRASGDRDPSGSYKGQYGFIYE